MSGSSFRNGSDRAGVSSFATAHGRSLPSVRKLVWYGYIKPEVAAALARAGWDVVTAAPKDGPDIAVSDAAVDVAVVDFGEADDERIAHIETLFAARTEVRWLAVASEQALASPRVCELIYDECFDFFVRPLRVAGLAASLGHAWGMTRLLPPVPQIEIQPDSNLGLAGTSAAMTAVRERLCKFASFDMPVLLTGETGTGKDVAARALHARSKRPNGPFIAINCGALPENLVQSELFGHERGAFTGASARKIGRIEAAGGGVVFLDEIGDLPLEAQCNLLRFLEAHTIERVGSNHSIEVDARVIAATHVDLKRAVAEGNFREDLYYRLNVLHVHLPALRERDGDAGILARHFLDEFGERHRTRARQFSPAALNAINAYAWPGNVRELINRVSSVAVTADKRVLGPADLGLVNGGGADAAPNLQGAREQTDRETIVEHLRACGFNMSECARRLEISRVTLYRLCKKYGLRNDSAALPVVLFGLLFHFDTDASPLVATCVQWASQAASLLPA